MIPSDFGGLYPTPVIKDISYSSNETTENHYSIISEGDGGEIYVKIKAIFEKIKNFILSLFGCGGNVESATNGRQIGVVSEDGEPLYAEIDDIAQRSLPAVPNEEVYEVVGVGDNSSGEVDNIVYEAYASGMVDDDIYEDYEDYCKADGELDQPNVIVPKGYECGDNGFYTSESEGERNFVAGFDSKRTSGLNLSEIAEDTRVSESSSEGIGGVNFSDIEVTRTYTADDETETEAAGKTSIHSIKRKRHTRSARISSNASMHNSLYKGQRSQAHKK